MELQKMGTQAAPAAPFLIAMLHDQTSLEWVTGYVRGNRTSPAIEAVDALGSIGDARAVEPLIAALRDSELRDVAAQALGRIGDARAVEPLISLLRSSDPWTRQKAVVALGKIGDARALEPLAASLEDSDWSVARQAAEELGEIGDARAVEPLIAALKNQNSLVRDCAAEALGKIGDIRAVEPLIGALRDREIRYEAQRALYRITGENIGGSHRRWHKWWAKNETTFGKEVVEEETRQSGHWQILVIIAVLIIAVLGIAIKRTRKSATAL